MWKILNWCFGWQYVLIEDKFIRRIRSSPSGEFQYVRLKGNRLIFNSIPDGRFMSPCTLVWMPLTFAVPPPDELKVISRLKAWRYVSLEHTLKLLSESVVFMKKYGNNPDYEPLKLCEERLLYVMEILSDPTKWKIAKAINVTNNARVFYGAGEPMSARELERIDDRVLMSGVKIVKNGVELKPFVEE